MSVRDQLDRARRDIERLQAWLEEHRRELVALREEVAQYRSAAAAIRWLWEQATLAQEK